MVVFFITNIIKYAIHTGYSGCSIFANRQIKLKYAFVISTQGH